MERLKLSEIAGMLGAKCPADAEINDISTDTRTIDKGSLFIAIKGDRFDAHDFVGKAVESGAAAAVTERQVEDFPCIVVESTRKALLDIAAFYRSRFSPVLVGVTGSVGKTTTKEMIALVLSEKYKTLKTQGNFNNEIGLPKTLFGLDSSYEAAVIEMGMSHFGEIDRLSKTAKPTVGVITNIGFSHIENLGSQEGILKAKLEILEGMPEDAPLVVNGDDKLLAPLKDALERPVYTYGIENDGSDFQVVNIREENGGSFFEIAFDGSLTKIELPCIGRHNIMNAAAAFCIGILNGLTPEEIAAALKKYKPDGMRQNIVKKGEQTVIIDCYNASPDSMRASLSVLSDIEGSGRRIAVLGDMLELGEASCKLHTMVGEMAAGSKADKIFCFGGDAEYIAKKASELGKDTFFTADKEELTEKIREYIKAGDIILFKASRGMKLEEVIERLYKD